MTLFYTMLRHLQKCLLLLSLLAHCARGFSLLSPPRPTTSSAGAGVSVTEARVPQDLPDIRTCRAAAFDNKPVTQLLESQQRFVNATSVEEGRTTCLVARRGRQIYGTADFTVTDNRRQEATISNVFVTPEARGQGIAKTLLQAIEDQAVDQGVDRLVLQVYTSNTPAYTLYRRNEFKTNGIHKVMAQIAELTGFSFLVEMEKDI